MPSQSVKILLTGLPGCGKTTAVMQIVRGLNLKKAVGFYTEEIRQDDQREGFRWKCLDGSEGILAHVDIKGPFRVSKYGVDVGSFEKSIVPILDIGQTDAQLFILDEIGRMECFSDKFVAAVKRLFASDKSVLATVALKGTGLIRDIKNSPNVKLFNLTRNNRTEVISEVLNLLSFLK